MAKLNDFVTEKRKALIGVTGWKGGVGKSHLALTLAHVYSELHPTPGDVRVIEFDADNDDVAKACDLGDYSIALDVTVANSWETFNKIVFGEDYKVLIVNFPAQAEKWIMEHGRDAIEAAQEGNISVSTVWALGPVRDSTNALLRYLKLGTGEPVFVARSVFQVDDPASDFEVWDSKHAETDLRGGDVFDHLKAPFRLRARMFDGLPAIRADGKTSVDRWSIKRYIDENTRTSAGAFYVKSARRYIDGMKKEIGVTVA